MLVLKGCSLPLELGFLCCVIVYFYNFDSSNDLSLHIVKKIYPYLDIVKKQNKERLHKKACKRYQNLSEEENDQKHQYAHECCENVPQNLKCKGFLSIEKTLLKYKK